MENSAARFPDKVAVIHEKARATYGQINEDANRLARFLLSRDIRIGDRVVIMLENSIEYIVAYYGILKAGAVAVPLSTDLKPDGLDPLLAELEPSVIIASARFERLLQASNLNVPNLNTLIIHNPKLDWSNRFSNVFTLTKIINDIRQTTQDTQLSSQNLQPTTSTQFRPTELGCIIYTSGSTGKPKGVMLTHGNIVANVESICQYQQLVDHDVQMVVLPFFYVMGKSLLNTIFAAGGSLVLNNKFAFPATVINQMIEEKVTLFSGVPSTYAYLLHRSPLKKQRDQLTHLRLVTQAGGHMASSVKKELRKVLRRHTQVCIMYGATEASARLTWLDPNRFEEKMASIGKPISGVTIKLIDANRSEVPPGEKGEVIASGANIMQGYWKDPDATAAVLDDNGYHTGDIGYRDEEGFIFLDGRKDNLLKVGGHRINPQEVEDALLATELVVEVSVVGIPDDLLGKRLISLAVPLNGDTQTEAIMEKCASLLPKYKLPSEIRLVRALPKNANGKVDQIGCLKMANGK
ncbi:long-chain fatty acid--CoA ligase [Desulfosarcina ovata subsp. sediminis]|uniref:Long-chain fatty acid--CoA ligase n=1 Tax=Desulfosarcina ovata subsp. sediminis TaxID=885957 RepID=A0A5K7ZJZ0_9BACT|nr:long-chain fatty acid--CoA ligase [Desulfosarcina ovata subsp. sediminis]